MLGVKAQLEVLEMLHNCKTWMFEKDSVKTSLQCYLSKIFATKTLSVNGEYNISHGT